MTRASAQTKRRRPIKAADDARHRPKITIEGDFLVLRWNKEQAAKAIDAADITLESVLAELAPSLKATKTIYVKRRGQITQRYRLPDWGPDLGQ